MKFFILNAFIDSPMSGNPAAVCHLDHWLSDQTMTQIAQQFGYSETAFVVKEGTRYLLRWFTPKVEVDLCGHATMAAAHSILADQPRQEVLEFETRSGLLSVKHDNNQITMDFPRRELGLYEDDMEALTHCLNTNVLEAVTAGPTILAVVSDETAVKQISPDMERIAALPYNALIPTAPGDDVDFVSRFFGPRIGIPEDPVTGAAHTGLAPFWSQRLDKHTLRAAQRSPRGGSMICTVSDDRVQLSGQVALFATGKLCLNE